MKVYLSGPISLNGTASAEQKATYLKEFENYAAQLLSFNHEVLNPADVVGPTTWEEYMRVCIPMLCEADVIVLLHDWERSRGSRLEHQIAQDLGMATYYVAEMAGYFAGIMK
jgi:hypothetical protein